MTVSVVSSSFRSGRAAALAVLLAAGPVRAARASTEEDTAAARRVAAAVESTLRQHAPEVHRCFERALADRLDVAGRLELEVDVGKSGVPGKVRIAARQPQVPEALADCVAAAARTWRLPDVEAGATVVLPLVFTAEPAQLVVRVADVPERGPAARGKGPPPFSLRILADPVNVGARELSATLWTIAPAQRVAMHRHPESDKVVYVRRGRARLLGPEGFAPLSLSEGAAVFVPRGFPHVLENMGRQLPAELVQVYAPGGPERVHREPGDPEARAHFEVVRDARVALPAGPRPVLVQASDVEPESAAEGKARARTLLAAGRGGVTGLSARVVELDPGVELPPGAGPAEFRLVLQGEGTLRVGQEAHPFTLDSAIYLPPGLSRGTQASGTERLIFLQVQVTPAGS